jgi:hypothetical protein
MYSNRTVVFDINIITNHYAATFRSISAQHKVQTSHKLCYFHRFLNYEREQVCIAETRLNQILDASNFSQESGYSGRVFVETSVSPGTIKVQYDRLS